LGCIKIKAGGWQKMGRALFIASCCVGGFVRHWMGEKTFTEVFIKGAARDLLGVFPLYMGIGRE